MNRVSGKVALITGAAMGMGRSHAMLLAREGAKVVVADQNNEIGQQTASEIQRSGGAALFASLDVAQEDQWHAVVAETLRHYGTIDILVNNAGTTSMNSTEETTVEEWDRIFAVNVKGMFLGSKSIMPIMKSAKKGAIINISSTWGIVGVPRATAYQATKGAVRQLTKALASELGDYNVRANSVHPGLIVTEMTKDILKDPEVTKIMLGTTPLKRVGQPEEVSYVVLFLASDESSYMTGSEVVVDGGFIAV
jgi:cyclopentanol dehydrogenase